MSVTFIQLDAAHEFASPGGPALFAVDNTLSVSQISYAAQPHLGAKTYVGGVSVEQSFEEVKALLVKAGATIIEPERQVGGQRNLHVVALKNG